MRKETMIQYLDMDTGQEHTEMGSVSIKRGKVIVRTKRIRLIWQETEERDFIHGDNESGDTV